MKIKYRFLITFAIFGFSLFGFASAVNAIAPDIRVTIYANGVPYSPPSGRVTWRDSFNHQLDGNPNRHNRRWLNAPNDSYNGVSVYRFVSIQAKYNEIARGEGVPGGGYCGSDWSGNGEFCDNWDGFRDALGIRTPGVGNIVFRQARWYNDRPKGNCEVNDMKTAGSGTCHADCRAYCEGCHTDPADPLTWICRGREFCGECPDFYGFMPEHGFGCFDNPHTLTAEIPDCTCSDATFTISNNAVGVKDVAINCSCNVNAIPTLDLQAPTHCDGNNRNVFTLTANDADGASDIRYFTLNIPGASKSTTVYDDGFLGAGSTGQLLDCGGGNLWCESGNQVIVRIQETSLPEGVSLTVNGAVYDYNDPANSASDSESFTLLVGPTINAFNFNPSTISDTQTSLLSWSTSGGNSCSISCSPALSCPSLSCIGNGSWTTQDANTIGEGTYNANMTLVKNGCPQVTATRSLTVTITDPWLMTAWGDSYVSGGHHNIVLQNLNDYASYGILKGASNEAYFSTYIISNSNNINWPTPSGRRSFLGYILGTYTDQNTNKIGSGLMYDYLYDLVTGNGGTPYTAPVNVSGSCSTTGVYFRSGTITFNGNYTSAADKACIFVSRDGINISNGVTNIEAFLLTDGLFRTSASSDKLKVHGGIITGTGDFQRDLINDKDDPAEISIYDAKYLYLLKDVLKEGYPFKIREWQYSKAE